MDQPKDNEEFLAQIAAVQADADAIVQKHIESGTLLPIIIGSLQRLVNDYTFQLFGAEKAAELAYQNADRLVNNLPSIDIKSKLNMKKK